MTAAIDSISFPLAEEDQARAGCYALLSRLFYAGPDQALLNTIATTEAFEGDSVLARAWKELATSAHAVDAESACLEYDGVFIGTGKASITPYATHYLAETGREKILAGLREELVTLGLARIHRANEPEDHIAALLEVMRHLILRGAGDEILRAQRTFYSRYIEKVFPLLCGAILENNEMNFYRRVSVFLRTFLEIESESLKSF